MILFFQFLPKQVPPKKNIADPGNANDILKVKTISKLDKRLEKIRAPLPSLSAPKKRKVQKPTKPVQSSQRQDQIITKQPTNPLGLDSLRLQPTNHRKSNSDRARLKVSQTTRALESGLPLTNLRTKEAVNNYIQQSQLKREKLIEYQSHQQTRQLLQQSNLNFHFIPPQGLKETEFNELNKVLFSFKRRMFISYVNSFISQYKQISLERPLLKKAMRSENHTLTGKITFDREGNIVKINILKSTHNDDIHRLFEETLMGIGSLPNPPKILIEDKDQFVIYYQLKVN